MKETKVLQIVKTFTKEELKSFGKFAESPYYNSSKDVVKLLEIIKKYFPDFENKAFELVNVFKKVYPGQKYHEGKIRNVISDLGQLAERFIAIQAFENNEFEIDFFKIDEFRKRKIEKLYTKLLDKNISDADKMNTPLPENYAKIIKLFDMKIADYREDFKIHKHADLITKRNEYAAAAAIKKAIASKQASMINKHNYNIDENNLNAVFFDSIDFDKFFKAAKDNSSMGFKLIELEYYLHKVFLGENYENNLKKFQEIFSGLKSRLDKKYLYNILVTLDGAYIYQFNIANGNHTPIVVDRIIENFDTVLKNKLYKLEESNFPPFYFRNICDVAIEALRLDWCESFVRKYGPELPEEHRINLMYYPLGGICFKRGEFHDALKYFSGITKSNFISQWQMKVELAQTHYELGNFETALSVNDAFMMELKRKYTNPKESNHSRAYITAILFRKLTKVAASTTNDGLEELVVEMNTTPGFKLRPGGWFTRKINELKTKKKYVAKVS